MSGGAVIVFAFDPVDELEGAQGMLVADAELAGRLVAERRAELPDKHATDSMRYVAGSASHQAAREALRTARGTRKAARKPAKLES